MVDTKGWILANKAKAVSGLLVSIAAGLVLPVSFVAWAEDLSEEKVRDSEIRQQAREEVIHGAMRAKHDLDRANDALDDTEEDLIRIEQDVAAGVELTPTQRRKYVTLQQDLSKYETAKDEAEDRLSNPEDQDES